MAKFIPLETEEDSEQFISLESETEQFVPLEEESSGGFVSLEAQPEELNFGNLLLPPIHEIGVEPSPDDLADINVQFASEGDVDPISPTEQFTIEAKALPAEILKGGGRFIENVLLGGSARLQRIIGDVVQSIEPAIEGLIGTEAFESLRDDMLLGPSMDLINNVGQKLTDSGSETSQYWADQANTGWEAVKESNNTPVANFVGQTSEAAYSSAVILGLGYLTGGTSTTSLIIKGAVKLSAQAKSIIAVFSALGASSSYEQIKDADGSTLEALEQFGLQTAIEYFGETTAFGDVFKGEAVGVSKLAFNSMLEEGGVGFAQDIAATFHVSRLEGASVEDSYSQALDVAYSNLPQNSVGGIIGATTIGTVGRGVNRYKVAKYTNLVNSAADADAAVQQLQETTKSVIANPAEAEAAITSVVHDMPDGSTMPGAEHEGSVKNSARQVELTSEELLSQVDIAFQNNDLDSVYQLRNLILADKNISQDQQLQVDILAAEMERKRLTSEEVEGLSESQITDLIMNKVNSDKSQNDIDTQTAVSKGYLLQDDVNKHKKVQNFMSQVNQLFDFGELYPTGLIYYPKRRPQTGEGLFNRDTGEISVAFRSKQTKDFGGKWNKTPYSDERVFETTAHEIMHVWQKGHNKSTRIADAEFLKTLRSVWDQSDPSNILAPPNPYLNPDMDILRVLADAEHGVTAAEQAVMQRIDELQYFEEDYNKALRPESKKPIKSTAAEIGDPQPAKVSKPKPIKNVKIKGLEDDAGKKVLSNLRAISGSNSNFIKLSNLANSLGGVPASGQARQSFINDLNNVAKTQRKFSKKLAKLEGGDEGARIFNPWVESRYSLAQAEQITGKPLRRLFVNIIGQSNGASDEVISGMTEALDSIGVKKSQVILNQEQANAVTDYLFEESSELRDDLFNQLDEQSEKVVGILDDLLQGPIANEVRQARWYKWNDQYNSDILKVAKAQIKAFKKGEVLTPEQFDEITKRSRELVPRNVVDSITDYETVFEDDGVTIDKTATERNRINAATQILKEGRIAEEGGQLRDWIAGQTWGTRAHFYMSESRISDLVDFVDSQTIRELSPSERAAKAGTLVQEIGATKERKTASSKKKSRAVIRDVMNHWERVATFNATHDDVKNFWDNFDSAIAEFGADNISSKDVDNIRKLLGTATARPIRSGDLAKVTTKAGNLFWTAYFADISRSGRFAVRNLKQNVAYLSSQLSPIEMTKAVARLVTGRGRSAQELSNFDHFWKTEISQKRQMFNHFIMSDESSQTKQFGQKYSTVINSLGSLAMRTDEANRKIAFKMAYEISTHNLELFNQGQISHDTLMSRLKIDTLNTSERLELKGLLNTSQSEGTDGNAIQEEFIKRYTSMKVMNTHFGYDIKHKSLIEQDPGSRQIIGPFTYFRGRAQIINQSVIKPLIDASQNKNFVGKQAREAIGNLFKFIIGSALAGKAAEKMGYEAYSLVSDSIYTPLSPGVGMAIEASQEIDFIMSEAGDEVMFETSVARIADVIGGLGEMGVPLLNTMSNLYENQNDVAGVTTMKRVKNLLYEQGWAETEKSYNKMDRTLYEKIGNFFWGGFGKEDDRQVDEESGLTEDNFREEIRKALF